MRKIKYIVIIFLSLGGYACFNSVPKYYYIQDCLFELFKVKSNDSCNNLAKTRLFTNGDIIHLLLLFKINYTDKNGKGNNYIFEPGGFGKNGILHKVRKIEIRLVDKKNRVEVIDVSNQLYRDAILENVTVAGKGFLNFNYDSDCSPMGLSEFTTLNSLAKALNNNDRNIHKNRLLKNGVALSLDLKTIPVGKYIIMLVISFMDSNSVIEKYHEIEITK
jgi:hypothetical protein